MQDGVTKFLFGAGGYLAAKLVDHGLHPVTDSQHR